jgi:hypothetical protein
MMIQMIITVKNVIKDDALNYQEVYSTTTYKLISLFRIVKSIAKQFGQTTMRYPAVIIICVRGMIYASMVHAKEHRSRVLNVRAVMEMDVPPNLVSA